MVGRLVSHTFPFLEKSTHPLPWLLLRSLHDPIHSGHADWTTVGERKHTLSPSGRRDRAGEGVRHKKGVWLGMGAHEKQELGCYFLPLVSGSREWWSTKKSQGMVSMVDARTKSAPKKS